MRKNRDKNVRPRKGDYLCHTKIQNVNVSGNVSIARNETLSGECSASKPGRDTTVFQSQRPTLFQIKNRETNGKQFWAWQSGLGSCCLQSEGLTLLCRLRVRARFLSCRRRNSASLCKRLVSALSRRTLQFPTIRVEPVKHRSQLVFLLLILAQAAHSVEEYATRLYEVFPPAHFVSSLIR